MKRQSRKQVTERGSKAVRVLEDAWRQLQAIEDRIPDVVIVILGAGTPLKLGHFAMHRWAADETEAAHEIALNPRLFSKPADLVAVMLHEAAHAILWEENQNAGVSSNGDYHRTEFRDLCQELGLYCGFVDTRHGWTLTRWPKEKSERQESQRTKSDFQPVIRYLKQELPAGIGKFPPLPQPGGKPVPKPGRVRLECECPRLIYVAASVADKGGILCELCNKNFLRSKRKRGSNQK